jgi:hypothetical protein
LPQCVEQSDASPVILGGFVRVSKQRRAIGGPEPLVEMNRPGAWVGNHSPIRRARKIPRRGGGTPCKLLDLSVLAISTALLDTCGPGTLPVESSPTRPLAGPRPAVVQSVPGLTAGRALAVVLSLVSSPDVAELASMRQAGLPQRLFPGCYCAYQTWPCD